MVSLQEHCYHSPPWHCSDCICIYTHTHTLARTWYAVPEGVVVQNEFADVLRRFTVDAFSLPQHVQQLEHGDDGMEPYSPWGQHLSGALLSVHYDYGICHLQWFQEKNELTNIPVTDPKTSTAFTTNITACTRSTGGSIHTLIICSYNQFTSFR